MTAIALVSIIGLLGWLVLAGSEYRSFQLGGRKSLRLVLIWLLLFAAVGLAFHHGMQP